MKGKLVLMMKKWWMIAAVFALALSLTSCSRRLPYGANSNYGLFRCTTATDPQNNMGTFDIYTVGAAGQPGIYKVVIIPASLALPGEIVTITAANQSTREHKVLSLDISMNIEQEVFAGYLSESELQLFDKIAISSYVPGVDVLNSNPPRSAVCHLPVLGEDF